MEKYFKRTTQTKATAAEVTIIIDGSADKALNNVPDPVAHQEQDQTAEITKSLNLQGAASCDEADTGTSNRNAKAIKKRKCSSHKYNSSWEQIGNYKRWLQPSDNPEYLAFCTICNCYLKGSSGRNDLTKHSQTECHLKNAKAIHHTIPDTYSKFVPFDEKVSQAEFQLAALIAEHNLPFLLGDHLVPMLKSAFPDSQIIKRVTCGRLKLRSIVVNIFGCVQQENLTKILKTQKFSICVDESTDISTTKILSTVVRFSNNFKITDCLLSLKKVTNADSKSIYNSIIKTFNELGIDYKSNLIGYGADGANNMTGRHNSVATLLKQDCPNLIVLKCICHSFAICASYACLKMPSYIETMVRDIYNYIQNSPKRTDQFEKIMKLLDFKPKRLLHPSQTRWLSLEAVVDRILELYEPLKIYFSFQAKIDNIDNSKTITDALCNVLSPLYLKFLKFILPEINKLNRIFQSESPQIHLIYLHVKNLLMTIFDCFLKAKYLKCEENITNINYKLESNIIEHENLYLGTEVSIYISENAAKITANQIKLFKDDCINFFQELSYQILKRFDFDNEVFQRIGQLEPKKVYKKENTTLVNLFHLFPNLVSPNEIQKIDSEYREIRNVDFSNIFGESLENVGVEQFWKEISLIKRGNGEIAFPLMGRFVFNLLSLPNSSANVERTFSQINLNKTKTRNRLDVDTLEGILFCKDYLRINNCNCYDVTINSKITKMFNADIYKSKISDA